jgi:hypothetical protein
MTIFPCTTSRIASDIIPLTTAVNCHGQLGERSTNVLKAFDAQRPMGTLPSSQKDRPRAISRSPRALNFRVLLRLRVRTLAECFTTQRGRSSLDLSPPSRPISSAVGQIPSPHVLADEILRERLSHPRDRQAAVMVVTAVLRGINPTEPRTNSLEFLQPP